MPKKTFFNLLEEQRTKIIELALNEFAEHDYNAASLNNIINTLDVTKGGFYRYFDNKSELYDYLVEYVTDEKLKFINAALNTSLNAEGTDFFGQLKQIMYAYLKFDLSFPVCGRFLFKVKYFNSQSDHSVNLYKLEGLLKDIIREALNAGTLSREYDVDFIYYCIIKLAEGLEIYINRSISNDSKEIIPLNVDENISAKNDLEEIFNRFIQFLRSGLSAS